MNQPTFENIAKDRKSQKELYYYLYENLFHIPLRYNKTRAQAEEIFNDGVLKVFKKIDEGQPIKNLLAFSAKLIFNTTIDALRKQIKYQEAFILQDAFTSNQLVENALNNLEVEDLFKVIQSLPCNQRAVFSLYEIDGYSHKEIAKLLNISIANSKYLLSIAKKSLRQEINKTPSNKL